MPILSRARRKKWSKKKKKSAKKRSCAKPRSPRRWNGSRARRSAAAWKRLAEKARAFLAIAPQSVGRFDDADARSGDDFDRAGTRKKREWRLVERNTILCAGDAQRLAQPAGPGAKQPRIGRAPPPAHDGEPRGGLQRPN